MIRKSKKTKNKKQNKSTRASVSSGKHLSTWVGHQVHVYSIVFIAISAALPSQKCVLSLDDVMLQVQRIYVHRRPVGMGGGGSKVIQCYKGKQLLEPEAFMQHLKNRAGWDARLSSPLRSLAQRLKGPSRAKTPPTPTPTPSIPSPNPLWSKSYFKCNQGKTLDLLW